MTVREQSVGQCASDDHRAVGVKAHIGTDRHGLFGRGEIASHHQMQIKRVEQIVAKIDGGADLGIGIRPDHVVGIL